MTQIRFLCLPLAVAVGALLAPAANAAETCADPSLKLMPQVPAMVTLTLAAPCHPGEGLTITHAGLRFPARTDDRGGLTLTLPVLTTPARVDLMLAEGRVLTASAPISDLAMVARVALLPIGTPGLHLRAPQAGTRPAITAANPGKPDLATGGFLTVLGDSAQGPQTEVLSLPADTATGRAVLHADVDATSCGHDLLAMIYRNQPEGTPSAGALTLAMPACTAPGRQIEIAVDTLPNAAP